MDNVWAASPPGRPEFERLGPATHRALADSSFLVQLARNHRLPFLPFALNELEAWTVLFLATGMSERHGLYANPGDRERLEILSEVVSSLIAADSWSHAHQLPVLTCPADERVRHLFDTQGLSDCFFIPVAEFLGRLEQLFRASVGERGDATLRVFPGGRSQSPVPGAQDQRRITVRGSEVGESSSLPPAAGTGCLPGRADEPARAEAAIASRISSLDEPRRQLRALLRESHDRIIEQDRRLARLEAELLAIKQDRAWRLASSLVRLRRRLIPANTRRERLFGYLVALVRVGVETGPRSVVGRVSSKALRRLIPSRAAPESPSPILLDDPEPVIPAVGLATPLVHHRESIDVVVWVDRGYAEARACLESLVRRTRPPYRLIVVHDGRDAATLGQLGDFAASQGALLLSDPSATSLASVVDLVRPRTNAEFVAFVRCTTVVTRDWLDRLAACMADRHVGIAVPVSNRVLDEPPIGRDGERHDLACPVAGPTDPHEIASRIAADSGRLHSPLSHYDDDCLLVRRSALADGLESSGSRAWIAVLADDAYVHTDLTMAPGPCRSTPMLPETCHPDRPPRPETDRVLEGIRARSRHLHARHAMREDGRRRWEGKRLLILMPVAPPCGVASVILQEASAMQAMGVDVRVLNLEAHREAFEACYPDLLVPTLFVANSSDLSCVARDHDAVIATAANTVEWMRPCREFDRPPRLGYYIQDYEPYLVTEDPRSFWEAWSSYLAFPELIRFTKTEWTRDEVKGRTGADCLVVGPSVNVDLFRPRPRRLPERPCAVRIAAMVRPAAPCRQPRLTMEVLRAVRRTHGNRVEILIFGGRPDELDDVPADFPFFHAGVLDPGHMAGLLNEIDIFVDLSSHQAMGSTAMEAMCCGAAVIVPTCGGAQSFVRHEENGFVVDTSLQEDCIDALNVLVGETSLRQSLQERALRDIGRFFPERAAYRVLEALFPDPDEAP